MSNKPLATSTVGREVPQEEQSLSVRELDAPSSAPRHAESWSAELTPERVAVFWSRTAPDGECLLWTGGKTSRGYGSFCTKTGDASAHRIAWSLANGAIPAGLVIRHKCDRPPCVAPTHLLLGTHLDNARDKRERRRDDVLFGSNNPRSKVSDEDVVRMRQMRAAGTPPSELARMFGIRLWDIIGVCAGRSRKRQGGPLTATSPDARKTIPLQKARARIASDRLSGKIPRATLAVAWLAENGGTVRGAASRFDVSYQAVSQAWRRTYGNTSPPQTKERVARDRSIVDAARSGDSALEIAGKFDISAVTVLSLCKRAGVKPRSSLDDKNWDAALEALGNGASLMEASVIGGVSSSGLAKRAKAAGIQAKATAQSKRGDGRTSRAVARILAGESVTSACRAEQCSIPSVYPALRKHATLSLHGPALLVDRGVPTHRQQSGGAGSWLEA